jgi:hypothetical protein
MSAGGISYDMVYPRRTVTLPSVEGWGTNMNILKDPPKSIHTRKIDKVSDTQEYTLMLQASGDRIAENIQVYPRGVNPMVSVNYGNQGTSGGQNRQSGSTPGTIGRNGINRGNNNVGTKMPYTIQNFRPPVLTEFDLLPLSRLPRTWNYAFSNPSMTNYVNQSECQDTQWKRALKDQMLKKSARPTAVYKIERPLQSFKIDNAITNKRIKINGNSGLRFLDRSEQKVQIPKFNLDKNYQQVKANVNKGKQQRTIDKTNVHTTSRIKSDKINARARVNPGQRRDVTPISDLQTFEKYTHDTLKGQFSSQKTGINDYSFIHDDIELEKNVPLHSSRTNTSTNYQKNVEHDVGYDLNRVLPLHSSRTNTSTNYQKNVEYDIGYDFEKNTPLTNATTNINDIGDTQKNMAKEYNYLPPQIQKGGFLKQTSSIPTLERVGERQSLNSQRHRLHKLAFEGFMNKFGN